MEIIQVVGAVLVRDDGHILACRRAPGRTSAGLWEFPGGKVEAGESPEAALRRELQEELGFDAVIGPLVTRDVTEVNGVGIDLACYRVKTDENFAIESADHDELRWVAPGKLFELDWARPDLPAVRELVHDQARSN